MSKNYALKAEKRDRAGKGVARALRREDKIPAVIYGDNKDPLNISLPANDVNLAYNKGGMYTTLCDMDVDGETILVLARDVQVHPVSDIAMHADFLRVTPKTMIAVSVPVQLINENKSPGIQEKGVINMVRFEIELHCSAMAIPDFIEVDLDGVEMNQTLHISDVKLPEGVKPVLEHDFTILNINEPRRIEVEVTAEEGEGEEGAEGDEAAAEGGEGGDAPAEGGDAEEKSEG